jgi:hypothetical protein
MTYADLKAVLDKLTPEELEAPVTIDLEELDDIAHIHKEYFMVDGHHLVLYGY